MLCHVITPDSSMTKRVNPILLAGVFIFAVCSTPRSPCVGQTPGEHVPVAQLGSHRFVHHERIDSLALSLDGSVLFAVSSGEACLWDVTTGKKRQAFKLESSIMCGALSRDGRTVVLAENGAPIHVFNATTGQHITELTGAKSRSCALAVTADGRLAASGDGEDVVLWDVDGGRDRRRWKHQGLSVGALQFSPDDGRLAIASSKGSISIQDLAGGKEPVQMAGESGFRAWITFAPNGKTLAGSCEVRFQGGSRSSLRIWDATTGVVLHDVPGSFDSGAFSPDGRFLAASGLETTRIYDTATGSEIRRLPDCHQHVRAVAFSRDGKTLATGQGHRIRTWDADTWHERTSGSGHAEPTQALAFSPDGRTIATGGLDGQLILWAWPEAQERLRMEDIGSHWGVQHVTFSPDGLTVAATAWINSDDMFFLFDAATGAPVSRFGKHHHGRGPVAFLPGGKTALTGQVDGSIAVWDSASGTLVRSVGDRQGGIHMVQPMPTTGTAWWVGEYQGLGLRDLTTGKDVCVLAGGTHHSGAHLVVSRDSDWLAVGNRVWDLKTCEVIAGVNGGWDTVSALSPDGRLLATPKSGGIVLWEALTQREIHTLGIGAGEVKALAFSPDGTVLAAAGNAATLIWDVTGRLQNGRLPVPALDPMDMESQWQALGGEDAWAAHQAAWALASGGRSAVAFLSERLSPAPPPDPLEVQALRGRLTDPDYDARELAARKLLGLGIELHPDERELLRRPDPISVSASLLFEEDAEPQAVQFLPPPLLLPLPERVRSSRAVVALERSGEPLAESLLAALAKGESTSPLTREARGALAHVRQRRLSAERRCD